MKSLNILYNTIELLDSFQLSLILGGDGGPITIDEDIDMPDLNTTP
jgi:hypothetical protein